jgi:cobalamin biosynthesis Mg chelatase CobN
MIVGKRHLRGPSRARHAFGLLSVMALFALACFPVLAHAEDSSGVQYSDSLPKAEGENAPSHHQQTPAKSSSTDKNGGAPAPTGTTGSKESTSEEDQSSTKGGAAAGNDPGTGQGSPGGSAPVQSSPQAQGTATSQKSDDGGSSPLIPILVAILVLAAISLAIVWFRQRRQDGPTAPPAASQKAS